MAADPGAGPGGGAADRTTVADLVVAGAARDPGATAVVAGGVSVTYAGLDTRANRLAGHLQGLGVGPDVRVGVCLGRSVDLAVSLQAVIRAGGACLPLDPSYPTDRLHFMVDDARPAAVVTSAALAGRFGGAGGSDMAVLRLDADEAGWAGRPEVAPPRSVGPDHLGYVVYTSGSTGRPKGVMLTHRGLVNHHRAAVSLYGLGPADRVLQFCSIGFDASVEEMFPTWAAGATVVFRPEDLPLVGQEWLAWLRHQRITVMNLPTAYWHEWTRDMEESGERVPDGVRLVVVGGEKALGRTYRAWVGRSGGRSRWINAYGPAETTCMSTTYEAVPGAAATGDGPDPPIGRPLPNTSVRVIDAEGDPVARGEIGELLIGGAGLARGYLNRPELTAERFTVDAGGGRWYRTGDLVRELAGGDLEFVGRLDDQVKIRGFRIECGEVEASIARHPAVDAVAVVARPNGSGARRLVAYVAGPAEPAVTPGELRRFVAASLPPFMVPSVFVVLDVLPRSPNGKVDRDALPEPAAGAVRTGDGALPRSPTEAAIAAIWTRVLLVDAGALGVDDDFFDLGGHSLLATQVIARIREEFGTDTPLQAIFEAPTVAQLATVVDAGPPRAAAAGPLRAAVRRPGDTVALSIAQEQMWALEVAAEPEGLFNITAVHRFDEAVDEGALRAALAHLVDRHEILRTAIVVEPGRPGKPGRPVQSIGAAAPVELRVTDLRATPEPHRTDELRRGIEAEDARPFDLASAPLVRAHLFRLGAASSRLTVTMDHLVADGTAASILMAEAAQAYRAIAAGRAPDLPVLPIQFADFAIWQRRHLTDDVLDRQLAWWAEALHGLPPGPAVPFDHLPATPTRRIVTRALAIEPGVRARLDEVARATGSSVFIVAAAGVQAALGRFGGTTDVVLSTTLSGRNRAELEGMLGMFSGIGRLRTDLAGDPPFSEVVARARRFVLGMFDNQDIPFMRVRRALLPDFPTGGPALAAALPVELQYFFHTGRPTWGNGDGAGRRPQGYWHDQELFFRGQLHPLSITLLDDGRELSGDVRYKADFYDEATVEGLAGAVERVLDAVGNDPTLRGSDLPVTPARRAPSSAR